MRKQFMLIPEWIKTEAGGADDAALGAWVRLHSYCAQRLNDGMVIGAKLWSNDACYRVCAVRRKALDAVVAAGLADWQRDDLVLRGYDHDGQALWLAKSHGGKSGRLKQLSGIHPGTHSGSPQQKEQPEPRGVPTPQPRGDCESDSDSESIAPVAAATNDYDDRTLKFIRSLGGYLDFRDEDKRPDWLSNTYDMTLDQIREVFDYARSKGITITLPGKGPGYFGGVRDAMRDAARKARVAAQEQAEAAARAEQDRADRSGKEAEARAKEQANRSRVGGILATFDEDPAKWLNELSTTQVNTISNLREYFNKRKPLALHMRYLEFLPAALVEQGAARGAEMNEHTEGATA